MATGVMLEVCSTSWMKPVSNSWALEARLKSSEQMPLVFFGVFRCMAEPRVIVDRVAL